MLRRSLVVMASGALMMGLGACAGEEARVLDYDSPPGQEASEAPGLGSGEVPPEGSGEASSARGESQTGEEADLPPEQAPSGAGVAGAEDPPSDPGGDSEGSPPTGDDAGIGDSEPSSPVDGARDPINGTGAGGRSSGLDTTS